MKDFYITADRGRWGATIGIKVRGGKPPYRYTIDELVELDGPEWKVEWSTGVAMSRSIQVIDALGVKVSKAFYEPPHYAPTREP